MDALSTNSEIDFWQSSTAAAVLVTEDYTIGLHRVMSFDIASSPSSSYLDSSVYPPPRYAYYISWVGLLVYVYI